MTICDLVATGSRSPLTLTGDALLTPNGGRIDGRAFSTLRDCQGWRIETDDPAAVCAALGVPADEPGITAILTP